ncbi:hypothetical protein F511_19167 [Dorcoceras hygrometricum]|uniref:Uncharacterized protein n=1 Tax=Dorcoceras hygrometricum TaxID=472368 RepID=A0A2Z7C7S6_9LAMI|nr:hypothetical protein F511_19167 [Dorcoceras hygrometricum]
MQQDISHTKAGEPKKRLQIRGGAEPNLTRAGKQPKRRNLAEKRLRSRAKLVSLARWNVSEGVVLVSCENMQAGSYVKDKSGSAMKEKFGSSVVNTDSDVTSSSRNAKIFSRGFPDAVLDGPDASAASSRCEIQSLEEKKQRQKPAKEKDASTFTFQRSVAHLWKEDKIAFWSAEEFWKLSNGKYFYRGYILEATQIEEERDHRGPAVQSERDAMRSFSWCIYNTVGNIH